MPERRPTGRDAACRRLRSIIPTILLIMLSVMIVRDIFVRRWGAAAPPARDVTTRQP